MDAEDAGEQGDSKPKEKKYKKVTIVKKEKRMVKKTITK